jgi:hypothetical protein
MPTPLSMPRPLGFLFCPHAGGPTAAPSGPTTHYLEAGGATIGPSSATVPPLPPAPNAAGGLIVASGCEIAHGTEAGGQIAQPFMTSSLPASPTFTTPHVVPTTSIAPNAAPTTPPVPCAAPASTTPPAQQLFLPNETPSPMKPSPTELQQS